MNIFVQIYVAQVEIQKKMCKKNLSSLLYMSPVMLLIGKQRRLSNICYSLFANEAGSRLTLELFKFINIHQ